MYNGPMGIFEDYEDDGKRYASGTQGGGLVRWSPLQRAYVFIENPPQGFELGDFMPEEWGIAGTVEVGPETDFYL